MKKRKSKRKKRMMEAKKERPFSLSDPRLIFLIILIIAIVLIIAFMPLQTPASAETTEGWISTGTIVVG